MVTKKHVDILLVGIIIMSISFLSKETQLYARDFRIDDPLKDASELLDYLSGNKDKMMKHFRNEEKETEKEATENIVVHDYSIDVVHSEEQSEEALEDVTDIIFIDESAELVSPALDYLLLVNKNNPIDRDYGPDATINLANHVRSTKNEVLLAEEAALQYIEMINAMESDGLYGLAAVSGYRSYDYQANLYQRQINRHLGSMSYEAAAKKAGRVVAPPGTSEHQTGLAIDVSASSVAYDLSERFANTKEFQWLNEYCHQYGFIIRYSKEKSDITDIIYEPWHLRYVGVETADNIKESGLCLEEYLNIY